MSVFQELSVSPRAPDPFGTGVNMPVGYINDYFDASIVAYSRLLWKGADNQGTWLTGIDPTDGNGHSVPDGAWRVFENLSDSGIDVGQVGIKDESSAEAQNSRAECRVVCPGGSDYMAPIAGLTFLQRGVNKGGDPRWLVRDVNGWLRKAITQSLQIYPGMQVGTNESPLSGTVNNWNPVGVSTFTAGPGPTPQGIALSNCKFQDHTFIRMVVGTGGLEITGLYTSGETNARDWGPVKVFLNLGPGIAVFRNLHGGSDVANRLNGPNGGDVVIGPGESFTWIHPYNFSPAGNTPQWWTFGGQGGLRTITPAALSTGAVENYAPTGGDVADYWRLQGAVGTMLGGIAFGRPGRRILLRNFSSSFTIVHASSGSDSDKQIWTPSGSNLILHTYGSVWAGYDQSQQRYFLEVP